MKKTILILVGILILYGCASEPLFMKNGEDLDSKIKSGKMKVVVLPTVDYGEGPGFCGGFFLGGISGAFWNGLAYKDGGLVFTNQLTKSLWKQNVCYISKPDEVLESCRKYELTKSELFPANETMFLIPYAKPISTPEDVGNGNSPNYEKLYNIGNELDADIILISRLSNNMSARVCTYAGGGASVIPGLFPWSLIPGFLQGIYNSFIDPTDAQSIQVDLIALDIKSKNIISFGQLGAGQWVDSDESTEKIKLDDYGKGMVFYFNLPSDETKQKQALASAASYASTVTVNYVVNLLIGVQIGSTFTFEYDITDVTWQQYAPEYFENNFGWDLEKYYAAMGE